MTSAEIAAVQLRKLDKQEQTLRERIAADSSQLEVIAAQRQGLQSLVTSAAQITATAPAPEPVPADPTQATEAPAKPAKSAK